MSIRLFVTDWLSAYRFTHFSLNGHNLERLLEILKQAPHLSNLEYVPHTRITSLYTVHGHVLYTHISVYFHTSGIDIELFFFGLQFIK